MSNRGLLRESDLFAIAHNGIASEMVGLHPTIEDSQAAHRALRDLREQFEITQRILIEERRWREEIRKALEAFHTTGSANDYAKVRFALSGSAKDRP